jgi:hypothetical protein
MLTTELQRTSADGRGPQARGLQNRGRSSADVHLRSVLSANVHCIDRVTANDSQVLPWRPLLQERLVEISKNSYRPSRGFLNR